MKLQFLGTDACIPKINEDTPSFVINDSFLFDTGWSLYRNLTENRLNPLDIEFLFFTHLHHDHYISLPDLLFCYMQCGKPLDKLKIIGPSEETEIIVKKSMDFLRARTFYPCAQYPQIIDGEKTLEFNDFRFEGFKSRHPVPGLCYKITENKTGACLGATGDTSYFPELGVNFYGCDALIHEICMGLSDKDGTPHGHSSVADAIKTATSAGVQQLFLIHHSAEQNGEFYDYAKRNFNGECIIPKKNETYYIQRCRKIDY